MNRYTALINPISGGGQAERLWQPIAARLHEEGVNLAEHHTASRDNAIELATEAAKDNRIVVAVGGDGFARDIAAGVVPYGGTMAIVPAGRGNDLADHLQLPNTPDTITNMLIQQHTKLIDVLDVNGVIVPGNAYFGIDAMATQIINRNRWIPARVLYRLAPVRAILNWKAPTYTITIDGETRVIKAHTVVIAGSGAYGHGLKIVPPARLDDGVAHIMIVDDGPRSAVVSFMDQAKTGAHVNRSDVEILTGHEIHIDADRVLPVCGDGDEIGQLPAIVRVKAQALRMVIPH